MQCGPALLGSARVNRGAHHRIAGRHRVDAVDQGFEVQHRAAHQQGNASPAIDLADQAACIGHKQCGRVGAGGLDQVDQVVRHGGAVGRAGLGSADVQAPVDLGRIDADDLDRPAGGGGQGEGGLATGRRAGDADGAPGWGSQPSKADRRLRRCCRVASVAARHARFRPLRLRPAAARRHAAPASKPPGQTAGRRCPCPTQTAAPCRPATGPATGRCRRRPQR